jgi:hypothetical protein
MEKSNPEREYDNEDHIVLILPIHIFEKLLKLFKLAEEIDNHLNFNDNIIVK